MTQTDTRAWARLVARLYHDAEVLTKTVPARTETVMETVLVDEQYTARVPRYSNVSLIIMVRAPRYTLAYLAHVLRSYSSLLLTFLGWVGAAIIRRGNGASLSQRLRDSRARRLAKYQTALSNIRTKFVTATRQVEKTVQHEREVDPEHTVEEAKSGRRVVALGRGGIGFQASPSLSGVVVTGPEQLMDPVELHYPTIPDLDRMVAGSQEMESALEHVPWVLDGASAGFEVREQTAYGDTLPLRGLEREIKEHCDDMQRAFSSDQSVAMRLLAVTDRRILESLEASYGPEAGAPAWAQELTELSESPGGRPLERFAENWVERWQHVDDALVQVREESLCDQIAPECFDLGTYLQYSAFNFYCPRCNAEKLGQLVARDYSVQGDQVNEPISFSINTRCLLDTATDTWQCTACEFETIRPIPVHKMLDEILLPAFDRLMDEHQVERVRAHQDVRTREIEIRNSLEGEVERAQFDNLGQIDALVEEMERLSVDISGERLAITTMEDILEAYEVEQNAVMKNIQETGDRTDDEIQRRTQAVLEHVNEIKDFNMAALREELNTLARAKREDDERRDAVQRQIATNINEVQSAVQENTATVREEAESGRETADLNTRRLQKGMLQVEQRQALGNAIALASLRHQMRDG